MANPALFFVVFSVFSKQTMQFLQQLNVKECHVHPVFKPMTTQT